MRRACLLLLPVSLALACGKPTDLPDERRPADLADLYVAPPERGGDDANPGDRSNAPLATLGAALAKASTMSQSEAVTIAVVQGVYPETLTVVAALNVSLAGGHDSRRRRRKTAVIAETEALTGGEIKRIFVDEGYCGHDAPDPFRVYRSGQKRGVHGVIRKEPRRRSAIEAVIGHLKTDGHLGRNDFKVRHGDQANAVLPS